MSELLGEARVLIRPDTTAFRAELEAQVLTAAKGVVVPVPVTVQPVSGGATTSALGAAAANEELNATLKQQGAQQQRVASTTRDLAAAQTAGAVTAEKLAFSYATVDTAASAVGAAQVQATRAAAAVAAAEDAVAVALRASNIALIDAASRSLILAKARDAEAIAALRAARAESVHAASLGQVSTAGIASGASLLGLRGAVLTAGAAFLGATVAIQAASKAILGFAEFQKELNTFRAVAQATDEQMKQVSATAKQLGRDVTLPGVAAQDAAIAMTELAKAGLSVQDAVEGTRGSLQLATAAEIDNKEAVLLVASALNAFGLRGRQATEVADLLTGAANESQGEITDMGTALQQASAVARLAGLNLQETVTLITQLAQAGLRGSDAGTSLRTALIRLIKPSDQAKEVLSELNVQIRDQAGNIRADVFIQLSQALEGLSKSQRDATLALIFGQDALRAAAILGRSSAKDFAELEGAISRQGLASELAGARTQGLSGSFEQLSNAASSAGLVLGAFASGPLQVVVEGVAGAVGDVAEFGDQLQTLGSDAADATPGVRTAGDAVEEFGKKAVKTIFTIQLLGPGLFAAKTALDQFTIGTKESGDELNVFDSIAKGVIGTLDELAGALRKAAGSIKIPKDSGLNVKQLENVVSGFDERELKARISGDTATLISVLEQERDFLNAQLDREFVQNRPELRRKLEQALLGVTNDLASISADASRQKQQATADLARSQRDADNALLKQLSLNRQKQDNAIALAGQTTGLQDDIKAQQGLLRLIKRQITVIREQVQDEEAKRAAIADLVSAKIATRSAIKQLKAQQAKEAADRKDQIQNLNIQIAEERGNDAALRRAINQRIKTLNKQIAAAKGDQVKVKQLILERERLRNQLKDLNKADKDTRDGFKTFVFEQLQAQQGFASNLLGNIIRGPTTGLVGVPAPPPTLPNVDDAIRVGQGTAAARQGGSPTAGQQNTVIALLERILGTLKQANRADAAPESKFERRQQSSSLDGIGGGGTNAVM